MAGQDERVAGAGLRLTTAASRISDDTFRARHRLTVDDLERWCFDLTLVAEIEREPTADYWRLAVQPAALNACPVEIIVHHRSQTLDLAIGSTLHPGLSGDLLEHLAPLCRAIEVGRVVTRRMTSTSTGRRLADESVVSLADGTIWRDSVGPDCQRLARELPEDGIVVTTRHYTPWRRVYGDIANGDR